MLEAAVAFVTFNRPAPTAASFARIRAARPTQLFLISDGPRGDRPGEAELVRQTRAITEQVDWDCRVRKIYAETNMGCGQRISSAITQAFEHVDKLIVLEDDCVAEPTFFDFCFETLNHYERDNRVMSIGVNNFQHGVSRTDDSYYFSKYTHCWGWATWRRAWRSFQLNIPNWPEFRDSGGLATYCRDAQEIEYWTRIFDRCYSGKSSSWAFPWMLSCWMNHGLSIVPDVNLVTNIGFGSDATHTQHFNESVASLKTESLSNLQHPTLVNRHQAADRYTDERLFSRAGKGLAFKRWRRKLGLTRRAA